MAVLIEAFLKVSERADSRSLDWCFTAMEGQGQSDGQVQLRHQGERDWVEQSANETEILTDSWINLAVAGLPSKRHSAIGRSRGSQYKGLQSGQR